MRWRHVAAVQGGFAQPHLDIWSIRQAEFVEITGGARDDYERELRITALGNLMGADCATALWRCVCCHAMYVEIRGRSSGQRVAMELALLESMR
jgi:hypothetical protein